MKKSVLLVVLAIFLLAACGQKQTGNEWLTSDDVVVAVDETFRGIMEEEAETFGLRYPTAAMKPFFCSEDSAIRLLLDDSIRMCIATRPLSKAEKEIVASHTLSVTSSPIATDALALIVNKANSDSLITLDEIKGIVAGKITRWEQLKNSRRKGELKLVFDHSGSSTVRFMKDSLNGGRDLAGNVFAQGSNLAVIQAVKENPEIIGVIGANWLNANGDTALSSFKGLDFNVLKVSRFTGEGEAYFRPFQYYIATGEYPLLRTVYVMTTDPRTKSMMKNFYFFLKGQVGQTIICDHSQMLPHMPVQVKDVSVK